MQFPIQPSSRNKLRLDIAIGSLLFVIFILIIARVTNKGTPSTRANTWGIAVCLKSAVSLAYQVVTVHVERFKRWGSSKANKILAVIDTIFWFALFIITIIATQGSHNVSSRALGAIIAILAVCYICFRIPSYFKLHGTLPDEGGIKSSGNV
ncbi:hypothetical protein N7462_008593 [Penicillium macrosclerotiorum]|uniref:uncharacterized protein n=1 Tax=Penicillium macrosclerotiorum TaxID=303699 RepID=UPI0025486BF4|nr:uncharacterized protein N7462_008593 [Penicillium macrosclerotiorum]KAJ5675696.1 hypothetical protein N7462_008593 [Penicillium macrosclerotiorum]